MQHKIENVTPAKAAQWLEEHNTHNRPLRENRVAYLSEIIRRGEWRETGEPVQFAEGGELLNGQHRLAAIVETGQGMRLLIVRGLARLAQEAMDQGGKRSVADALALRGYSNTRDLAAAAKVIITYRRIGTMQVQPRDQITPQAQIDFVEENPRLGLECISPGDGLRKVGLYMPRSTGVSLYFLMTEVDREEALPFFARLVDGAGLGTGDPILALRRQLLRLRGEPKKTARHVPGALTIKAFNLWREGAKVSTIVWRRGGSAPEAFPIIAPPLEQAVGAVEAA